VEGLVLGQVRRLLASPELVARTMVMSVKVVYDAVGLGIVGFRRRAEVGSPGCRSAPW
jgi:hypothetical protein